MLAAAATLALATAGTAADPVDTADDLLDNGIGLLSGSGNGLLGGGAGGGGLLGSDLLDG